MQIIIPMSGYGERFIQAGYRLPKPLIEVEKKPIISHVVDMFPSETNLFFVCNKEHLENSSYHMKEKLLEACPTSNIISIEPHKKGPVYATSQIYDHLTKNVPTIVNYCDFNCYWDYSDFLTFIKETCCDGAIPCYRGFHPHSLGSTFYAYVKEKARWAIDIQEKIPFTDQPMNEYASSGTYYFSSASLMQHYFDLMQTNNLEINGEYYVSLAFKQMMADDLKIAIYELQHFMQWGTPEDLEEYIDWSDTFRHLAANKDINQPKQKGAVLIPMAGLGERFKKEGYKESKPLIPVSGNSMVIQAARDLPHPDRHIFILRSDMPEIQDAAENLKLAFPQVELIVLDEATDGQARTCLTGLEKCRDDAPLTIGACDNGVLYNKRDFENLLSDEATDVILWGIRGYAGARRNPHMYGWIAETKGYVQSVSVKEPLDDVRNDPIIIGTFTFKKACYFKMAANRMIDRGAKINGEYYVDTCINDAISLGLNCKLFEVDSYLCWGTPDDLRTFEYWQSCFHKWSLHPYHLENDPKISSSLVKNIENENLAIKPKRPSAWPSR